MGFPVKMFPSSKELWFREQKKELIHQDMHQWIDPTLGGWWEGVPTPLKNDGVS